MNFSPDLPTEQAYMNIDHKLLAALLHLPDGIVITAVRADPSNAHNFIFDLDGAVPASGALEPDYKSEWTKVTKLRSLRQV